MSKYPIHGIDGSRYQFLLDNNGDIIREMNFEKAKAQGISFILWRMTVGDYYFDKTFPVVWRWCMDNGMPLMPYHVTKGIVKWGKQWAWIKKYQALYPTKLPLIQDLEVYESDAQTYTLNVQRIMQSADDLYGRASMLYTNLWADSYLLKWSGWIKHPLIAASWLNRNQGPGVAEPGGLPVLPRWWKEAKVTPFMWQWSADKPVSNEDGPRYGACSQSIDRDVFMGTVEEWEAFIGQEVTIPDPEPDPEEPPVVEPVILFSVGITATSGLKVRSTPEALEDDSNKIGVVIYNAKVDVYGSQLDALGREWYQIELSGKTGYVAAWYCKKV